MIKNKTVANRCVFKFLGVVCYGKHLIRFRGAVQPLLSNSPGVISLDGASGFHPSQTLILLDLNSMLMLLKLW